MLFSKKFQKKKNYSKLCDKPIVYFYIKDFENNHLNKFKKVKDFFNFLFVIDYVTKNKNLAFLHFVLAYIIYTKCILCIIFRQNSGSCVFGMIIKNFVKKISSRNSTLITFAKRDRYRFF